MPQNREKETDRAKEGGKLIFRASPEQKEGEVKREPIAQKRPPQHAAEPGKRPSHAAEPGKRPPQHAAEPGKRPPQHAAEPGKRPSHAAEPGKRPPQHAPEAGKRPKKKRRLWPIFVVLTVVLLIAGAALGGLYLLVKDTYAYYEDPDKLLSSAAPHKYEILSKEDLLLYLAHPSLYEGDVLVIQGDYFVDVEEDLGGFLSMGLVNFDCTEGSVTFTGGNLLMSSGREGTVKLDGVAFAQTNLFIEAPQTDLVWKEATGLNQINVRTLNGQANRNTLYLTLPGAKLTMPVTLRNLTEHVLTDVPVQLMSPYFLFVGGDSLLLSFEPLEEKVVNVDVIVTEGGNAVIRAVGADSSGERVVEGQSEFIELLGGGYYAGDPHTHTKASYTDRDDSTLEKNVRIAAEKGMSFIISCENDAFGEKMPQSEVDQLAGGPGRFLQLISAEPGQKNQLRHYMLYNYSGPIPDTNYMATDWKKWTMQQSIFEALDHDEDAIVYIPHPFGYGLDITESVSNMNSIYGVTGMEILDQTSFSDWTEFIVTLNIWDNLNIYNRHRMFGIGASNNIFSEYVASRFTKMHLDSLKEENIYEALRNGDMFATNGPELRFSIGGAKMGEDLYVNPGEEVTAKIYAASRYPLTRVRVLRYNVDGSWTTLEPDLKLDVEFPEGNVFTYQTELKFTPETVDDGSGNVRVIEQFLRLEVTSTHADDYDDKGMAFSNPIWISQQEMGSTDASFTKIGYSEAPPLRLFGKEIGTPSFGKTIADLTEQFYDTTLRGSELAVGENGVRYITGPGRFTLNGFSSSARENEIVTTNYHRYHSDVLADKMTVMVMAEDRMHYTVETIYLLDEKQAG